VLVRVVFAQGRERRNDIRPNGRGEGPARQWGAYVMEWMPEPDARRRGGDRVGWRNYVLEPYRRVSVCNKGGDRGEPIRKVPGRVRSR
jgi:hypothetical protein